MRLLFGHLGQTATFFWWAPNPAAAVALGACIVEKHVTLSRAVPGPDSGFSLEPQEIKAMVEAIRTVEKALGRTHYGSESAQRSATAFRRSLFVVEDVRRDEVFTEYNLRSIRPGHGLHTRYPDRFRRQPATCDIARGTPLDSLHLARGSAEQVGAQ